MPSGKKLIVIILPLIVISNICRTGAARSVYVVSDTGSYVGDDSFIRSYKIDGNSLVYQTNYEIIDKHAIGLAIDESEYGQFLFVTFEYMDKVELVNAKTMQYVDTVTATGADDLAGIAMDTDSKVLFDLTKFSDIII